MNLNHTVKVVGSVILSAVMAGSMMPIYATETTTDDNPTEKQETVYAVLNSDGSMSDTIVSSWLHDEDGINNIKETLNLKNVKNIKTDEEPSKSGNTYTWNADGNDVYYQGNATQTLPVTLKIKYELDGKEMSSSDMEGKSGHLKLTITFTNNQSETKTINGKSIVIHPSYLAGGIINMNTGNYTNVKCEQGKIVNDGSNEILAFANIPGLNETLESAGLSEVSDKLGISDTVSVEADVEDFDLGSIMIGMTNEIDLEEELGSIDSVSELTSGMDELMSAEEQLVDGSQQLADGTSQMNDGIKTLQSGVTSYTSGTSLLADGIKSLYKITDGVSQVQAGVSGKSTTTSSNLLDGATQLNEGLKQLKEQTDGISETQLDDLQKNLETAKNTLTDMQSTLTTDSAKLTGLQTSLEEATKTLDSLQKDTTLSNQITQLATDVAALNNQINGKDGKSGLNGTIAADNERIQSAVTNINNQIDTINSSITGSVSSAQTNIDDAYYKAISALQEAKSATSDTSEQAKIETEIQNLQNNKPTVATPTYLSHVSIDDLKTLTALDSSQIVKDAQDISNTLSTLGKSLSAMQTKLGTAKDTMSELDDDITKSLKQVDAMSQMISGIDTSMNYKEMMTKLKSAASQLYAGSTQLLGGVQNLNAGITQLQTQSKSGIDTLNSGANTLVSNNDTLNSGFETLATSFETLNSGAQELYEGQTQFKSEGLDQLQEKVNLGVDELNTLESVLDEIKAMNKKYSSYSGAPEGATVTTRYVFRTKEDE